MRSLLRIVSAICVTVCLVAGAPVVGQVHAPRKRMLVIGEEKGYRHDAVTHAMVTIEHLGKETGLWDTVIRTDTEALTKRKLEYNARNLDDFDAVVFYTGGTLEMDASQQADFLSFVHDDGKGFIGIHSATITFTKWPAYGEMIGGSFDEHPWGTFDAPVIVEDPAFPGMKQWPSAFTIDDEIYQIKDFSRTTTRVLMRLDPSKLDLTNPRVHRKDGDFAVTWAKMYGEERDQIGHFTRPSRPPDGNAAKRIHQGFPCSLIVGALFGRQFSDQSNRTIRLDPARRDAHNADSLRAHLLRQALAVIGQCRLRCRVGDRGVRQRQPTLNRRAVNDYARAALQHRGQQRSIQANRGEQIPIQRPSPSTDFQRRDLVAFEQEDVIELDRAVGKVAGHAPEDDGCAVAHGRTDGRHGVVIFRSRSSVPPFDRDGSGERAAFVVHDAVADEAARQPSGVTRLLGREVLDDRFRQRDRHGEASSSEE